MKKLLVVLLTLIFIAPANAQTPVLGDGWHDSYELYYGGMLSGATFANIRNSTTAPLIGGDGVTIGPVGDWGSLFFRGTGIIFMSAPNAGTGDVCIAGYSCSNISLPSASPWYPVVAYSITGLPYNTYEMEWKRTDVSLNFILDAVFVIGGDYATSTPFVPVPTATAITIYPTPTEITFYPTPTPFDIGTAVAEAIAEMTVEVTVLLPESTPELYAVPMTIEGTTGTQDGLFEYRATAGDSLITLAIVILIVLGIAQLGVTLWKR